MLHWHYRKMLCWLKEKNKPEGSTKAAQGEGFKLYD
jgi:hypothetical protein